MPTRVIVNWLLGRLSLGGFVTEIRLGKVKMEHRQMETGQWEDPLRYLKYEACLIITRGKMRATFKDE